MKTQALRQALDRHRFDAAFGGARRDEEKSRAKERVFSFRTAHHRLGPEATSGRSRGGSTTGASAAARASGCFRCRTGPSSTSGNTSTGRSIPVVPLYFAAPRPVVERDGALIMVDDERLPLRAGRAPADEHGALPHARLLSADRRDRERRATRSRGSFAEMLRTPAFRAAQGRVIDHDGAASMERKKQEGYF